MKTKSKGRVEHGKKIALKRWGLRFRVSIFPLDRGKHRVVVLFQGKEYTFAGEDRLKVMDMGFEKIRELLK